MKILNPNKLPTIDYRTVKPLQGELKDLTDKNYNKLKRVLEKRGFTAPLFIWQKIDLTEGAPDYPETFYLMDGHQRQRVMQKEGMNDEGNYSVPYILIEAANEQEAKAQLLEISSQYGTITQEGFDEFIADLPEAEVYEAINFDALPLLGKEDEQTNEDEAPPVTGDSVSVAGQIYQLGNHRLMCGDSTDFGQVSDLMNGELANVLYTDPPYNVDYTSPSGGGYAKGKYKHDAIFNDKLSDADYTTFLADMLKNAFMVTAEDASYYLWHADKYRRQNLDAIDQAEWKYSQTIVWIKNNAVLAPGQEFHKQFESCLYGWKPKQKRFRNKDVAGLTDVWRIDTDNRNTYVHPTQKPLALAENGIRKSAPENGIVLDLFGGSGSTLIACDQLNRTCYMMELDPRYCDVIRKRWYKLNNNDSDEGWELGTPVINAIAGEKQENNAVSK